MPNQPYIFIVCLEQQSSSDEEDEKETADEIRRFKEELQSDEKELLPLKINGSLVRRIEKVDANNLNQERDEREEDEAEEIKGLFDIFAT